MTLMEHVHIGKGKCMDRLNVQQQRYVISAEIIILTLMEHVHIGKEIAMEEPYANIKQ